MADLAIRDARPGEEAAISRLLDAAFEGPDEARLVGALRAAGDLSLLLVAAEGDEIIGCVAFSPLGAPDAPGARLHALAPLAVAPGRQRRGVGARLTQVALGRLRGDGATGAVVLGDPAYYGRFGFTAEAAAGLVCPWSGPHLQALIFGGPAPAGRLDYAPAFAAL